MNINEYKELVHKYTGDFEPEQAIDAIKVWIKNYAQANRMKKAVLGISGGKDSTVAAKLLVDVLGKDNVFGLLMPNREQLDIGDSLKVVELLDIGYETVNIADVYDAFVTMMGYTANYVSEEAKINIAPRIRMTTLYAWGQTNGYRVAGTGNLSERMIGYFTKWGDGASDFNILANFTSLEVMRIGEALGLPDYLVYKTPADGLTGLCDEEKIGISYVDIHNYLRGKHNLVHIDIFNKIKFKMDYAEHKLKPIPCVDYQYFCGKLPEIGKKVLITLHNGTSLRAFLTKTSFYDEGIVFETLDYKDIRVGQVKNWKNT